MLIVAAVSTLLVIGIRESANFNNVIVLLKLVVILLFDDLIRFLARGNRVFRDFYVRIERKNIEIKLRHGRRNVEDKVRALCILTGCHEMRDNVFAELKSTIHFSNRSGVRAGSIRWRCS